LGQIAERGADVDGLSFLIAEEGADGVPQFVGGVLACHHHRHDALGDGVVDPRE